MERTGQRALADRLLLLAADKEALPEVRAIVEYRLQSMMSRAVTLSGTGGESSRAHWSLIAGDFKRWLERRELPSPTPALRAPPGDPFGMEQ